MILIGGSTLTGILRQGLDDGQVHAAAQGRTHCTGALCANSQGQPGQPSEEDAGTPDHTREQDAAKCAQVHYEYEQTVCERVARPGRRMR